MCFDRSKAKGERMNNKKLALPFLLIIITYSVAFGQYLCDWSTFSDGSGNLQSTNYKSLSTVNQTAIGSLTSTNLLAYIGFWYPGILTGITEDKEDEIIETSPIVTKLYQAKPNPFRGLTAIRYAISAKTNVALLIHDVTGRLVSTLVSEEKGPGIYSLNWNGQTARNQKLSAGVYFYTLKTQDYTKTNKIVLTD